MTYLQSIILGIIEGITEFLPISSTAHLIISSKALRLPESDFLSSFLISIQLGAILSVAVLYAKTVLKNPKLILKIIAGFIPTALIGFAIYGLIKNYLLESLILIATALLLGGIVLIILEKYFAKHQPQVESSLADMTYRQAALIGVFQTLAVVPGVSRSAATIMGGLSLGISRKNIVEFSFLLALPTMFGATVLDLYKTPPVLQGNDLWIWIVGGLSAFVTAVLGIKFFLRYIQKNDFQAFGWYRIALGLILFAFILLS
ncbi:undecaprenyl-diphosphatase UppP [Candidatus Falkowbacteria bacterium HGW-Falkowbacteria-2]|uniref:Undecaprenyl-diphosphatase n=1 Tax=Candidatus Falkowbacteria bacterium HGW-Falkowbacteria-2 TaxID=2013769 RepID=A0A2N2DZG6_9BACT|nr:MAG: undecaprenyl-diphosphatase UppP [Candidatus Falkowbacteria bacterium HGW-Falkowbacteria-2]